MDRPSSAPPEIADLWSRDRPRQTAAYERVMALTDEPVDWAYDAWTDVVAHLVSPDNHDRAIAAQVLAALAKSDPDERILADFDALFAVTRDARFVTARHALLSMWKVGVAGRRQRAMLFAALDARFRECALEKSGTLVRYDVMRVMRDVYDATGDPSIHPAAIGLIDLEDDHAYRKKYASVWNGVD